MSEELKPCPFCGSADVEVDGKPGILDALDSVSCNQCTAGAPIHAWQGRVTAAWQTADTAPKDRMIIVDNGMPWAGLGVWNEPSEKWCITELECDLFQGQWNDAYLSHTFLDATEMRGWQALPDVPERAKPACGGGDV